MSEQILGGEYDSGVPRKWYKLEGGIKIGNEIRDAVEDEDLDLGEALQESARSAGAVDEAGNIDRQEVLQAVDAMLPDEDFNVYKLHYYDGTGRERELPSEVFLSTKNPEDFTSEAFRVREKNKTTQRTEKTFDDRIDHLDVLHQVVQGEGHGYAHRSDIDSENSMTVGDVEGLVGDILKGRDDQDWVVEADTRPWKSKMNPSPVELYNMAPESNYIFDHPDIDDGLGIYMDNYRDMIDMIVSEYEQEHQAWADVIHRDYASMAEHTDNLSEQGVKELVESFPEQMDKIYEQAKRGQ